MGIVRSTFNASRTCALLICALGALVLSFNSSAAAATYSVYACSGPQAEVIPNFAWTTYVDPPSQTGSFNFNAVCGDLTVAASPSQSYASGDRGGWVFDAPAGTKIAGYSVNRWSDVDFVAPSGNPAVSAGIRETTGLVNSDFDCAAVNSDCSVAAGPVVRGGLSLTRLAVGVRCVEAGGCAAGTLNELSAGLASARVDLDDPNAPVVTVMSGSLPGSIALAGAMSVDVTATDLGGGVARSELSIDGGAPLVRNAGGDCAVPYLQRQPCPTSFVSSYTIDTRSLANGQHFGSVRAIDAAGNVSVERPFSFTVTAGGNAPGEFAPTNGNPAVEQPTVRTSRDTVSARAGRSVVVDGRLTTASGQPIAGAVLDVSSLDLGVFDAKSRAIGTVTTNASGFFSTRVRPRGAQRITVLFRPSPNSLGTAVSSTLVRENLALSVKRSRARVRPRGRLRLSGRLTGAGNAARGAPVEIDVKIGRRWRAVDVVEANASGRYRWNYRFTRVTRATKFQFRAVVRRNSSWPWPTETSKRVRVLVAR